MTDLNLYPHCARFSFKDDKAACRFVLSTDGPLDQIKDWVLAKGLPWIAYGDFNSLDVYFSDASDAMICKLTWGGK